MSRFEQELERVRTRIGMYLPEPTYSAATALVQGYDLACEGGVLVGFREWLIVRLGFGNNLAWSALVAHAAFPDAPDSERAARSSADTEKHAIDVLFHLIAARPERKTIARPIGNFQNFATDTMVASNASGGSAMAHSIQVVGKRTQVFNDLELIALLCLMLDEVRRHPEEFSTIASTVRGWNASLSGYGPGLIELDLESLASSDIETNELDALLSLVEGTARRSESIPASFLNAESCAPGIEFSDYPSELVTKTVEKLRMLMLAGEQRRIRPA